MYDIIIKNGTVIDGSGTKEKFAADVAIEKGVIAHVGDLKNVQARTVIDGTGLYVIPGFIDVLNHSDTYLTLFTQPGQESLLSQGVTTIIGGNCGYSLAPLVSGNVIDAEQRWTNPSQINVDWLRTSEFLDKLKEKKLAINFGTLTGYNTLIKGILKGEYRQPSPQENEIAAFLLEQSLREGSHGLSIGFAYLYQDRHFSDHLESVYAVVKKHNKIVTIHLKDESDKFLDSLHAAIDHAREFGVSLHISHVKVVNKKFWPNFKKAIEAIERAAEQGISVTFDIFPYASSGLMLYLLLPAWVKVGGPDMMGKRLRNSFERGQIIKDLRDQAIEYDKITIASRAPDPVYIGKTVAEIAQNMGISPEDVIVELLLGSRFQVVAFAHVLDEVNVAMGIGHPLSLVASSGVGYAIPSASSRGDLPHPRSFGTFPRLFRKYVIEKKVLTWEQAIAKVTSIPAQRFGIVKRGLVREGYHADITLLSPDTICDKATFKDPHQYSAGIACVIVNGEQAYADGTYTQQYSGVPLYRT